MPTDRGVIDQQLQALGDSSRWWSQRELRDLPAVLQAGEQILALARGKVARLRWLRRPWLIVVTQKRLLCLRSGGRTSWRQLEARADEITDVSLRIGPFRGRVVVAAGGHTYRLLVPRTDAYKLQSALSSIGTGMDRRPSRFAPTRVVHRMIDHVMALPAAALGPEPSSIRPPPAPDTSAIDERFDSLERELNELREQVEFLEQLLRQRRPAATAVEQLPSI